MATADDALSKAKAATAAMSVALEREYIVFGLGTLSGIPQVDGTELRESWAEIGRATAANADTARDTIIDKLPIDEQDGPFVTIAARYWQPETFVVETTTVRKARR